MLRFPREILHQTGRRLTRRFLLFNVIVGSGCAGRGQNGRAQRVPLHQHVDVRFHVTLDARPGVCRVGEGGPLLIERVV